MLYCFGSLWSGNRRSHWWEIGFFRLSFRCFNFVFCTFLLERSVAYLISTNLFWSIFVTKPSSSFLLVLIIVCLPGSELVSLDEPALPLTFWQINPSSSLKGFGSRTSCTALYGPGVLFNMFVLVWLSGRRRRRRRSYTFINTFNTPQ